ncbi:hypothetical protein D9758_013173 [Tetrapyrgos nigripes]|uniref:Uncharacterized protein n=1 Tax=Tetrapyrgos nigripes TaxID=182062 RepID=A0A8H5CGF3_9AGAR|nr:hypothetical protein D9758_013173 [Tetrapyrgos nigripes]
MLSKSSFPVEIVEKIVEEHIIQNFTLNKKENRGDNSKTERKDKLRQNKALLSLALGCKSFTAPALRAIWHTLDSLEPLLKLLTNSKVDDRTYDLTSKPSEASLERFDFYARMVKKIIVQGSTWSYPSKNSVLVRLSVFQNLSLARPTPLPSLTSSECSASSFARAMMFFISPKLQEATFRFDSQAQFRIEGASMWRYLDVVKEKCPAFQRLDIDINGQGGGGVLRVPSVFQFDDLRHLSLVGFTSVETISAENGHLVSEFLSGRRMARLESLKLDIPKLAIKSRTEESESASKSQSQSQTESASNQDPDALPKSLKALSLSLSFDDYASDIAVPRLIQLYRASPVQFFQLTGHQVDIDKNDIFQTIASSPSWSGLATIIVHSDFDFDIGMKLGVFSVSEYISPLYELRQLRVVRFLNLFNRYNITNDDIWTMCEAWPELEEPHFGFTGGCHWRPAGESYCFFVDDSV